MLRSALSRSAHSALVAPLTGAVLAAGLTLGLTVGAPAPAHSSTATADAWSRSTTLMTVQDPLIREASGITRSTYDSDVVWIHNDSGDTNRVFAVGPDGSTRAIVTLQGAVAHDWEDIASGPGHTIWVGDTGNNRGHRNVLQVIKFVEPKSPTTSTVPSATYQLSYPDKRWDCEALMVNPTTGQVYVVTKSKAGGYIYRAPNPLVPGKVNKLTRLAAVRDRITGADFAPDGESFVLRNYVNAYVYDSIGGKPTVVTLPHQRQGESIGFDRAGTGLMIGSEGVRQKVLELTD